MTASVQASSIAILQTQPLYQGFVEVISPERICGWVIDQARHEPVRVFIYGDDVLMVELLAQFERTDVEKLHGKREAGFNFRIGPDLKALLGHGVRISVRVGCLDGPALHNAVDPYINNPGIAGLAELKEKFAAGFRINPKSGSLYMPLGRIDGAKEKLLNTYVEARTRMKTITGLDLLLAYGSLLGFEREGDLIAHDDDFDAAFVVKASTVEEAGERFREVAAQLEAAGEQIMIHRDGHIHWRINECNIDIFIWWHDGEGLNGYSLKALIPETMLLPAREVSFLGHQVLVPAKPPVILEAMYGPGWTVPNPSFQWLLPQATLRQMERFRAYMTKAFCKIVAFLHIDEILLLASVV